MKRLVNRTVNQLPLADSLRVEQTTKTTTTIGGNQKSEQVKKACYDVTSTRYVELKAAAVRPKTDRRSMRDTVKFVTVHSRLTQASELQKLTDRWLSGLIRRSRAQLPPAPLSPCCGYVPRGATELGAHRWPSSSHGAWRGWRGCAAARCPSLTRRKIRSRCAPLTAPAQPPSCRRPKNILQIWRADFGAAKNRKWLAVQHSAAAYACVRVGTGARTEAAAAAETPNSDAGLPRHDDEKPDPPPLNPCRPLMQR